LQQRQDLGSVATGSDYSRNNMTATAVYHDKSNHHTNQNDAGGSQETHDLRSERSDRSVVLGSDYSKNNVTATVVSKYPLETKPQEEEAKKPTIGIQTPTNNGIFPSNLIHDPQYTLDGMLVLKCIFCNAFQTPIEYDMKVHLRYGHRDELAKKLHLKGKGYNMEYRTDYVINHFIKPRNPQEYYDHKTAIFVSLHN
jgi:hypothetical protein